jgi:hypothetical protein
MASLAVRLTALVAEIGDAAIPRLHLDNINRSPTDSLTSRDTQSTKLAPKPQKACDHGLFSDEANQLDLVELFQDPTND